jgi:mannose-6-phosphate isomerase-like protein (cupin superfamily)
VKKLVFCAAALAFSMSLTAQPGGENRGPNASGGVPTPGPGAVAFPVGRLRAQLAGLMQRARSTGMAEATVENFGTYQMVLTVWGRSGEAEVDAQWDDVLVVEQGNATVVTGGRVFDAQTDANGETRGLRIDGGQHQSIGAGDVFTVRAGTPHQLILSPGTMFSAFVIRVHE